MEIATSVVVRSHPGLPVVPLRWLIVRDSTGAIRPQAFLCTDLDAAAEDKPVVVRAPLAIKVTRRPQGCRLRRLGHDPASDRNSIILDPNFPDGL